MFCCHSLSIHHHQGIEATVLWSMCHGGHPPSYIGANNKHVKVLRQKAVEDGCEIVVVSAKV